MLLAWEGGEAGWALLRTDLEGTRQWGIRPGARHLATDGKRIFASGGQGFHVCTGVECYSLAEGRPLAFGNGKLNAHLPAGGNVRTDVVSGLACAGGTLYAALENRNLIVLIDPDKGTVKAAWEVPEPCRLAVRPDGAVLVISKGKVLSVKDKTSRVFLDDHLDEPTGIAIDRAGAIYVANRGKLHNVSVYSREGRYLRSIGRKGGRPRVGLFDRNGMLEPGGIAVDASGKLWVAETLDSPKRISVWEAPSGRLIKEFFGGSHYSTTVCMDPRNETEVFCHMTVWKVDLDKGTWYPHSTMWRRTGPNVAPDATGIFRVFTARNGKQFAWGGSVLFMRAGDRFKPIVASIVNDKSQPGWPPFPVFADQRRFPSGSLAGGTGGYIWQDSNDDQLVGANEITRAPTGISRSQDFHWVDDELNLWNSRGLVYRPIRFAKDGRPVYDFTRPERISAFRNKDLRSASENGANYFGRLGLSVDPLDRSFYTIHAGGYARWTADGKPMWNYRVVSGLQSSLTQPIPRPGQVWGAMKNLGVAGDFTGVAAYFGTFHLFTRDGLYVAQLFKDQRLGEMGPNVVYAETDCGQLVKTEKTGRYLLLGGDTDGRVTEVLGLSSVKRFSGTCTLTPEDVALVQKAQAEHARLAVRAQLLSIPRGRAALAIAPSVTRVVDSRRRFTVRAAYDEQNLYVRYEVESPFDLVNSIPDPNILFKGGNLLDIQLGTNPKADPRRTRPVTGDVRLLITRQKDKPIAVLYRPKKKAFAGQPIVLKSPTGQEPFDSIEVIDRVRLEVSRTPAGFSAVAAIPLAVLGWMPERNSVIRLDLGYLFGNATGNQCAQRAYWSNNSPTAGIIGDVPSESRLEPAQWGTATVE
jgi:sugar lactone lactonase YvrE